MLNACVSSLSGVIVFLQNCYQFLGMDARAQWLLLKDYYEEFKERVSFLVFCKKRLKIHPFIGSRRCFHGEEAN